MRKFICQNIYYILLEPQTKFDRMFEFQTDDFYHETVTLDSRAFDEAMQPILDLPSVLQLSMHSTHEKHQNTLSNMETLQKFDISILANLIKL